MAATPRPGWYPDPEDETRCRWWDGRAWTDRVGTGFVDSALVPPAVPADVVATRQEAWLLLSSSALAVVGLCVGVATLPSTVLGMALTTPPLLSASVLQVRLHRSIARRHGVHRYGIRGWVGRWWFDAAVGQHLWRPRTLRHAWRLVRSGDASSP